MFMVHGFDGDSVVSLVIWLLVSAAFVIGIILVIRAVARPPAGPHVWPGPWQQHNAAIAELDLRYARGEIARDDYLQRRADLLGHAPQPSPGPEPKQGGAS